MAGPHGLSWIWGWWGQKWLQSGSIASGQIRIERAVYYLILKRVRKSESDITDWLTWFLDCLGSTLSEAARILASILFKARTWEQLKGHR